MHAHLCIQMSAEKGVLAKGVLGLVRSGFQVGDGKAPRLLQEGGGIGQRRSRPALREEP